jgi:2-keto-4-pentenoate hydratase/2-oxohepta-3-ene-1,7-dioic acid hydratase in catechol pathway
MSRGLTLLNYLDGTALKLGVKTGRGVLQVDKAARALKMKAPVSTDDLLQNGDQGLTKLVAAAESKGRKEWYVTEDQVAFAPAVTNPEKIVCLGLNYARHAQETNNPIPKIPILFNKFNNTLNSHNGVVRVSAVNATNFDYEAELVIVMGRQAANVSEADALSYVFGYATGQDFTARELQLRTSQWMIGKNSDGFGLVGPYIVCADLVGNPNQLKIEQYVNGEVRQSSNTSDMVFNCAQIVSYISKLFTLQPGDIIYTGTPEGVIQGYPKDKQVWLKPGDKLETRVEKLGSLKFTLA